MLFLTVIKIHYFFLLQAQYETLQNSHFGNISPYRSDRSNTKTIFTPIGQKAPLKHLGIVFKLSYPGNTNIGRLQVNLTATNCKSVLEKHLIDDLLRCLCNTSQTHLLKMSSKRILKFFLKNIFTFIYFSCFLIFGQNLVTTLSFRRHFSKKQVNVFIKCLRRRFYDQVSTLQE